MVPEGSVILQHLQTVVSSRQRRATDPALAARVEQIKRYQNARFAATYLDLLEHPRFAAAARFFLEDLYGPGDFDERDTQFARIVPALTRLFPREIVSTVQSLAELHALSETLDMRMAECLPDAFVSPLAYARAWQIVGEVASREHQVFLMLTVGNALDGYTRRATLRHSLRLMRGPARAAGLGSLQQFLERGFDTFRAMRGADFFLQTIANRERTLASALFGCNLNSEREVAALELPALT